MKYLYQVSMDLNDEGGTYHYMYLILATNEEHARYKALNMLVDPPINTVIDINKVEFNDDDYYILSMYFTE